MEKPEPAGFATMMKELDGIIEGLGDPQLDLDHMVRQVEQGYLLITQMRSRLTDAKGKIETLQSDFTPAAPEQNP